MKVRNGFVSNSSSSSFMIPGRFVSEWQLEQIREHIPFKECERPDTCGKCAVEGDWATYKSPCDSCDETRNRWSISTDDGVVEGYTHMDNFDMRELLENIGIPMEKVRWHHS